MSEPFDWSPFVGGTGDGERHPAVKWTEKGMVVKGEIGEVWSFKKDDKVTPVLTVEAEDGTVSVFVSQVDLRQKVAERNPQAGDSIAIRYDGIEVLESGRTMKRFSVNVQKVEAPSVDGADLSDHSEEPF